MGEQFVITATKCAFFEFISKHHNKRSLSDIVEKLSETVKSELSIRHAVFYFYNSRDEFYTQSSPIDDTPFNTFILKNGEAYYHGGQVLIPIFRKDKLKGILQLKGFENEYSPAVMNELAKTCTSFYDHCMELIQVTENEQKYEKLFHLTEQFHAFMNKDDVLVELITTLQEMYNEFIFYLFLSHDNENNLNLPIKDLGFDHQDGNEMAMEAFVTGKIQFSFDEKINQTILYTPLKGKQGVYGVLQVVVNHGINLADQDKNFIIMLANAAGTAMENAQLYDQSKRLIKDLQLINETSHRLNKNLRLVDTMTYMTSRIMESFEADEVGFFYQNHQNEFQIFPGSTKFFNTNEVHVYIDYIKGKLEKNLEGLFLGDITQYLPDGSFASVMAVPMVQSDTLRGCAIVLHKNSYHFSFDMFKLLQSLIHHSTLALSNSLLREELETLVKTDQLTQLYSRNYMNNCIENSMKADRQGTFLLIDIDNFKGVNDTFGHQVGDEVLVQVANIIKSNSREHDIGARWGGEELAVYLPQVDLEAGTAIAERIVKKVAENTNPSVTISCGVSYWIAENERNYNQLFSRADKALYVAKNLGKNQVIVQDDIH
ncbi:diguanylate cyclase [Metabacillus litoralis]|uniref:sensor domain-containing diguanylate cyclase n=1 Tax=Metabacillus TaxID=2675233 RepID=UPI001E3BDD0D|nr:GGDEF domain-containing protein [Metabacillus litoralis]MCM3162812.1 diguanylate cyclase [Metabacillus litoralis]UHA62204.1 diguanylate cyclase [Metabacillus litoralis]